MRVTITIHLSVRSFEDGWEVVDAIEKFAAQDRPDKDAKMVYVYKDVPYPGDVR